MSHEEIYFYSFVYMMLLLGGSAFGLIGFVALLKRKRHGLAWLLFVGLIAADLLAYGSKALPYATQTRGGLLFSDTKKPFTLAERRKERLFFEDPRFRYFRPPLYQEFSAFDLATLDYFVILHGTKFSPSNLISQVLDGEYLFQGEATEKNVLEFIQMGRSSYEQWGRPKQLAYLGFLDILLQDIMQQEAFYGLFTGFGELAFGLKSDIDTGFVSILAGAATWPQKNDAVEKFERLLNLNLGMRPEWLGEIVRKGFRDDSPFVERIKAHAHEYTQVSTAQYLVDLWYRYRLRDVNSLVRFKDYNQIADLFERPVLSPQIKSIRSRIRQDLAISAPMIRFFSSARILPYGQYYEQLSGGKLANDQLYIESRSPQAAHAQDPRAGNPAFSYQVVSYNPNRLKIAYGARQGGFLYFSDGYDRYWKASVDGLKTGVYKANGAFKAISIPAGSHVVEFVYDPVWYRLSLWLYYTVTIACILFLIFRIPKPACAPASMPEGSSQPPPL
ncbi:MAG TPA: YfhO family protein [Patescibacteria group bacterium]|nr:YfhO family protein [Patescibacteria group bacterium]